MIAQDTSGKTIASSAIVPLVLDSPLGFAPELYDLSRDLCERYNIADRNEALVGKLASRLQSFGEHTLDALLHGPAVLGGHTRGPEMSEAQPERLRTLGYFR